MKMHLQVLILLTLSGVLPQLSEYGVKYSTPVCAVRGFNVFIPCYYYYPKNSHVVQMLWCSMNLSTNSWCENPPYVYNSSSNTTSDFGFDGNNISDCTLLIHNVQFNYSGVYKFRFITNVTKGEWTGEPGVTLQVTDLKVSLIRLSGNGTLKQGDSLNLTCDVTCTNTSSQFVWSKNNQRLNTSGPVLHFPAVTVRDSGKYTCTLETKFGSGSETISLHVEGENPSPFPVAAVVTAAVLFVIFAILLVVIYRRWKSNTVKDKIEKSEGQIEVKQLPQSNGEVLNQEEVTYATVSIKDNNLDKRHVDTEDTQMDISVIYSSVKIK